MEPSKAPSLLVLCPSGQVVQHGSYLFSCIFPSFHKIVAKFLVLVSNSFWTVPEHGLGERKVVWAKTKPKSVTTVKQHAWSRAKFTFIPFIWLVYLTEKMLQGKRINIWDFSPLHIWWKCRIHLNTELLKISEEQLKVSRKKLNFSSWKLKSLHNDLYWIFAFRPVLRSNNEKKKEDIDWKFT